MSCLLYKKRVGLKASPVIMSGDGNEGGSAYIDQSVRCDGLFERHKRTESCFKLIFHDQDSVCRSILYAARFTW